MPSHFNVLPCPLCSIKSCGRPIAYRGVVPLKQCELHVTRNTISCTRRRRRRQERIAFLEAFYESHCHCQLPWYAVNYSEQPPCSSSEEDETSRDDPN